MKIEFKEALVVFTDPVINFVLTRRWAMKYDGVPLKASIRYVDDEPYIAFIEGEPQAYWKKQNPAADDYEPFFTRGHWRFATPLDFLKQRIIQHYE